MSPRPKLVAVAVLVLVLASLSAALDSSSARAAYDPVGSGRVKIVLDAGFLKDLMANGVKMSATAPATLAGGVLSLPATQGKFDPIAPAGTVESEGAFVLAAGGHKIPIKELKLRTTQTHSPFTAKVGGSQLKIATAKKLTVSRSGFANTVAVTRLALSRQLATRLGKKLDLRSLFKAGLPIGKASVVAEPENVTVLPKGRLTFTLDPGIVGKLESLFVAVNPIFPAEHQGPVFTFPIAGGALAPDAPGGLLGVGGAMELLQLGGGQVFWREPSLDLDAGTLVGEVDVEPSPPFVGQAGRLTLGAETPLAYTSIAASRTVTGSLAVTLDPAMAVTFNETFAKPQGRQSVFVAGEPLGQISFEAQGQ